MLDTAFDVFEEVDLTYLTISRGEVYGNVITATKPIRGLIFFASRMAEVNNMELTGGSSQSYNPTAYVHPEDFENDPESLIGNGIAYLGKTYTIVGAIEGRNQDNGIVEHYALSLKRSEDVEF